jgi:hypothetical protein
MAFVIGAIVVAVVIFFVGFTTTAGGGTSNLGNGNVEGCANACNNLVSKRMQVCAHRSAVAAATTTRDAFANLLLNATLAAIAAAAAAAAAIFVPIVGPLIAPILAAASAVAWAYVDFVLGQLTGATAALQVQINGLNQAQSIEAEATQLVLKDCPPETAQACINSLPVCPV